jgi:transcriptional regulator with XRE-family HTH domain
MTTERITARRNARGGGLSAFGNYVKREMEARNWTAQELEERSKVPDSTISRIIKTDARPNPANVIKIAKAFGAPVEELMVLAGYPVGEPQTPDAVEQEILAQLRAMPFLPDLTMDIAGLSAEHQRVVIGVVRLLRAEYDSIND